MDSKSLACFLATVVALTGALVGCGTDAPATYDFPPRDPVCSGTAACTDPDPIPHEAPQTMEDTTVTYVVSLIDLPQAGADPDGPGPGRSSAAGFNLDNLDSGEGSSDAETCEGYARDFVALAPDTNHVGVDNALESLVSTIEGFLDASTCPGMTQDGCLGATLQSQITDGSLILLMQVSGINDFGYDSEVQLQLVLGEVPGGGAPMIGSDGRLSPDQAFGRVMDLGTPVSGDIFGGRLRAHTPTLTITVDTGGFMLPLMISNAEVRFTITEAALTNGVIGGYLTTESIIEAASMIMPGIEDTVRAVVEGLADISPSAVDPQLCEAVSVGLTFGATTASIN
jgi:hypothetical protein